ncbi:MAG: putative transcriptional regulatory protein pdtaR [Bacteroidetes bacterium ADurb.Bin408]|nr:MAG: putative transcriptional regulatory protein pdtaR [Bacteroidetes bacterium ADurb.Bin408]
MAKLKILVVEDENIVAKDIQNSLTKLGYKVSGVVNSGEKAIAEVDESRPDLVLMDIMLKGKIDGIDTAKILRERYDIPVIFLTAYADENTLEKAKISEPYGYIIKPFKEKELQTTIEMAVYKHEKDFKVKKERDLYHSIVENKDAKDSIFVRADYRLNKVAFKDIYFVEALKDYVVINTSDNIYTTHTTMKHMIKILPEKEFVRVHRSYIVRLDKIFSIKYPDLVIEGKMKVIPIGGLYRKELFGRLNLI